ncbi:MAG: hypothetical protein ACJ77K_09530 [Bacteroidia bacterium]
METTQFKKLNGALHDGEKFLFVCSGNSVSAYDKTNGSKCRKWKVPGYGSALVANDRLLLFAGQTCTVCNPLVDDTFSFSIPAGKPGNFIVTKGEGTKPDVLFFLLDGNKVITVNLGKGVSQINSLPLPGAEYVRILSAENAGIFILQVSGDSTSLQKMDKTGKEIPVLVLNGKYYFVGSPNSAAKIILKPAQNEYSTRILVDPLTGEYNRLPVGSREVLEYGWAAGLHVLSFNEITGSLSSSLLPDTSATWTTPVYADGSIVRTIPVESKLLTLIYSPIGSGAKLACLDSQTGNLFWRKNTGTQLAHSRYLNHTELYCYNGRVTVVGNEQSIDYIQVFEISSGKILCEKFSEK